MLRFFQLNTLLAVRLSAADNANHYVALPLQQLQQQQQPQQLHQQHPLPLSNPLARAHQPLSHPLGFRPPQGQLRLLGPPLQQQRRRSQRLPIRQILN
jgi:hypothetical protein